MVQIRGNAEGHSYFSSKIEVEPANPDRKEHDVHEESEHHEPVEEPLRSDPQADDESQLPAEQAPPSSEEMYYYFCRVLGFV